MGSTSQTRVFLNFLIGDDVTRAKEYVTFVNDELEYLRGRVKLNGRQKEVVKGLFEIVGNLKREQIKGACSQAKAISSKFESEIEDLIKTPTPHNGYANSPSNQRSSQSVPDRQDKRYTRQASAESSNVSSYPGMMVNVNVQADLEYRSKMAGQAMRHNNPDIADLSDVNRPTKIAERFSELYDNEWTEAFEALNKPKFLPKEEEVIAFLLDIVEEAYRYCNKEADDQIETMKSSVLNIMNGGTSSKQTSHHGRGLLVQYRKSLASLAVERLVQNYISKVLPDLRGKRGLKPPTKPDGKVNMYTKKAVELTWWMCVQDPPIHMCLSHKINPADIPSMYKAYTRTGKNPDFFVWPALKLHKDGGLLMKGVVQFK